MEKTTTYRLHIAQPQTVGREMEFTANPAYMLHKSVRTEEEYQLKELRIDRNDKVKSGDIIAVMQGLGSRLDVEQKKLERDAYAAGVIETENYYTSNVAAAKAMTASTESERDMRRLKIEHAEAEYELYKLQAEHTLGMMDDIIAAMEAAADEVYIYAPVDGTIRTIGNKYREGDIVPAGTELCVINAAGSQRIYGTSGNGTFVYGREVEVTLGRSGSEKTYIGRVVSSPEVQPGEFHSSDIYISIGENIESRSTDGKAKVNYTVLDGVITVPSNAVTVQDGVASVRILDGNNVRTRSIVRGPIVGQTVTVLQGLKEGDQVVVSSYNS